MGKETEQEAECADSGFIANIRDFSYLCAF